MESSIPNNISMSSAESVTSNYEMDSSNEDIDQQVLRETGEQTISAEWSATVSALNSSDTTSSNSYINIETLKECCANPSDTLKDKEDFMVFESSSAVMNISKYNANDTKYSECKTTAFQKKHKSLSQNFSRCFENILVDDSQMEITQNSICLNRFQKRKRLIPPNDEDFIEINNSNHSGLDSVEVSMMKSPKFCFSRKKKDQFDVPDYNLSATDSVSVADYTNVSKRKENISDLSLVVNDSSNSMNNVLKTEVIPHKFSIKTIGVADSVFENIINNSSITSDITLNNKKTSLDEISLSNANNTSVLSKIDMANLNNTYDIPNNTDSTSVKASITNDDDKPKEKQNVVFKKPSNLSILVNDSSNNIMDVSQTEVITHKFSRKSIGVQDSAFDNIINDSSITSDIALNNKKTSLNEISVSNVNNTPVLSKMDISNLNHTYDIPTHINTSSDDICIASDVNTSKVKENTDLKKPLNSSILLNDSSKNMMDKSKTEVFTHKFSRKTIDVTDSVFDNIINDSSVTPDNALNSKETSMNETSVSNVNNTPVLSKMDMSNLNHTYDIPTHINISKLKENTDFKKPLNSSILLNDSSKNIMDKSKTEVFTHKFSRKTIDVTDSVFDNIINDSSITTDNALNNKKTSLNETSLSNVNNTPVLSKMDMSNLNHTYDIPTHINTSSDDICIASNVNTSKVKENNDSKKPSNSSILVNGNSNNIMDVSKTEVLTHKFKRKTMDITHSVFDNIINDSSMISDSTLNNEKISLIEMPVSNINNIPVFSTMDVSKLNHTYDVPINNNTTLLDDIVENDKSFSETPVLLKHNRSKSFNLLPLKFNFSNKFGRHSLSYQENCSSFDGVKKHNLSLNTVFSENTREEYNIFHKSANNSNVNLKSHSHVSKIQENDNLMIKEIQPLNNSLLTNTLNQEQHQSKHSINSNSNNEELLLSNTSTKTLENDEFQKNQLKHSMSSTLSNEGLTILNSTTGLLESCSSSRNQSRFSTSKHSKSSTSNNDTLNLSMESLDSNESQKNQSKCLVSSTSSYEELSLTNSTPEFSKRHNSSRSKSMSSKHSTSIISNNDNLTLLNATTEISVSSRLSKNQSKHSASVSSNSDSLTLLNSTMGSIKSNESQKTQSKRSISPTSYNKSLKSINSSTEFSGKRSSSRNKSTSVISNNDSLTSLNDITELSVEGRSSRNHSKHSTSVNSNSDSLTLLHSTMGSIKSDESQKSPSKRSISPTSYYEGLNPTNSTTGFSGRRSSSRNKSMLSKHSTSVISNNDSLTLLNATTEISVCGRSSRNQSEHSTSVNSNSDSLTVLNATMGSLKSNESQETQSKRSLSPSYSESLEPINSTTELSEKRSSSRNKSMSSKHSTSVISNNDSLTSLNAITEISVGRRSSRNQSKHSNSDSLTLLNATMESLKSNESQKTQSKRSLSPTSYNESLKPKNSITELSEKRSSSRNKSMSSKHSTNVIPNNDSLTSLNAITEISVGRRSSRNQSKHSNSDSLTLLNATMESLKSNESQKTQSKRSLSPTSYNESLKPINSTAELSEKRSSSRNKSMSSKHSTSVIPNNDSLTSLNAITEISVGRRSSRNQSKHSNSDSLTLLNATMGSLKSNKSQKTQSKRSISPTSYNKSLKPTNSSSGFSGSHSLSRNKSSLLISKHSTSVLSNNDSLTSLNTTTGSLKQNLLSINGSNPKGSSSIISESTSINAFRLEDVTNNVSRRSTRLSKQKSNCMSNVQPVTNNESFDNSDNSLFWTTLPDEVTNISSTQDINVNTFQTPRNNKLTIAENIVNTIKIMSINKQKSTHPGAFELDDHNDGPLTRSFATRSYNRSPSILTLVFGGKKISESTSLLTQSISEINIDQLQVEENVKQKFKSLYKKESWITKRLYKFLVTKLQPNYNIYSVKYAEKFVKYLAQLFKQIHNDQVNLQLCTDMLRYHMARYQIIKDTFDYLEFLTDFIPMAYYKKLVPGWNFETSAVKFNPQKYYTPLMDDEEFLNYIMEHLQEP